MSSVELLIKDAAEVVTLAGPSRPRVGEEMSELKILKNVSVAVVEGRIVAVGKDLEVSAQRTIDAKDKTVVPGFVDPHTHLVFGGSREFELDWKLRGLSYMEIKKQGGGIGYTVKKTRQASDQDLYAAGLARLKRMMSYGTTSCEAKSGYGLDVETEKRILKITNRLGRDTALEILPTFLGAHDVPAGMDAESYTDVVIEEMLPACASEAVFCDVFCEEGVFTPEQSRRILEAGKRYDLTPKIHADEIVDTGGAGLAAEVGAISADHLLRANDEGLKRMAEAGTIGVMLPGTPFALMMKEYAPARRIIDLGVPLALATDLNPNCWVESMQFMMQLACFQMRLTPAEALTAATFNAACAIGRQEEIGSIEVGKQADLLVLECPNHMFIPYHFGVNLVESVIKKGVLVGNKDK